MSESVKIETTGREGVVETKEHGPKNMGYEVVAITVTFNRTQTLEKTLQALQKQSHPVSKIIVADNGSNEEHKKKIEELTGNSELIEVLWLGENRGGAGGFEAGMRRAQEMYDPDWYWLMDDDAYPREDTLECLLAHRNLPELGALLPVIFGVDWQKYQLYHAKRMFRFLTKEAPKFQSVQDMEPVEKIDADAFVGPLFPKKVVQECGVADGGLFIYGDDTEYTTRVHQKYELYLIRDAVMDHNDPPLANDVFSPKTYWKLYYTLRNRILLAMKYNSVLGKVCAFFLLTGDFLWQVAYCLIRSKLGKSRWLRLRLVCKAYLDGLGGKKGKTVDPVIFAKEGEKYVK